MSVRFTHAFAMPSAATFSIAPIADFVRGYLAWSSNASVDPFAGSSELATYRNDIDPGSPAPYHLDAEHFCVALFQQRPPVSLFDLGLFDPPYSPRQISEVYRRVGLTVGQKETQNGALYRRVRDAMDLLIAPGGYVLSFGWNSQGMGKKRGYELIEVLLVAHGGAHNDTICIAERKDGIT